MLLMAGVFVFNFDENVNVIIYVNRENIAHQAFSFAVIRKGDFKSHNYTQKKP